MPIKIALAGNPNSGKTTLFNVLTGSAQYVGNWPGVTVEKKEGRLKDFKDAIVVDLPGIYSLSPYTLEEVITRDFLMKEKPEVVINIIDATNLERNLYLTTQLVETGIPMVIALNMMDVVEKSGDKIDLAVLSAELGVKVVGISAQKGNGVKEVVEKAIETAKLHQVPFVRHSFSPEVQTAVGSIESVLRKSGITEDIDWFAIKLFERDEKVLAQLTLSEDSKVEIDTAITACENQCEDESVSLIANQRYQYIDGVIHKSFKRTQTGMNITDKIDRVITNRWLAIPIFALIMWSVYYIAVTSLGSLFTGWVHDDLFGKLIAGNLTTWMQNVGAAGWLQSLIVDGIIGGVGAVLGFVPQIILLFLLISFLEDCGYMSRVAFIMDRIFRKFGLSGKSFIPMLIGTGCSVPAIMAARTIENDKDRKMTIMLTPFVPCSAKLPIFALMTGIFFPKHAWVAPSMYFLGIAMVILSGLILKHTKLFTGDVAPFVMEMPRYHMPSAKNLSLHVWDRVKAFIIRAGTVIFAGSAVIWFLQSFNWHFQMADAGQSMLSSIGTFIAPIFIPLGFGNWQSAVSTIAGILAKENVVATFGVLFGSNGPSSDLAVQLSSVFTGVSAYSFMVFNLLASPCIAAIGAMRREMGGWKWTLIAIGYQTGLAYVVAMLVYQFGSVFFLGANPLKAIILVVALIVLITLFILKNKTKRIRQLA